MLTVLEIIKRSTEFLAGKGVESPRLNAELLIGHALGRKRMQLYLEFERPLTEAELALIRPMIKRRSQREPLQYILGEVEFGGVRIKVDSRALIPRPETELLVELVLAWCGDHPPVTRVLELGTGTGAIALALARRLPGASITAVERCAPALALARENVAAAEGGDRVLVVESDWYDALAAEHFDVIVANPPYLSQAEMAETAVEVGQFEPGSALAASDDGCSDLEKIIRGAPGYLKPGGLLALETGIAQHPRLLASLRDAKFANAESKRDLTGRDRFILAVL